MTSSRTTGTWLSLAGVVMVAIPFVAGIGIIALTDYSRDMGFIVAFASAALVTAVLVWRFQRFGLAAGVLYGIANLAYHAPHLNMALRQPDSFLDFAPSLSVVTGSLLCIGAGLYGLRSSISPASPAMISRTQKVLTAIVAGVFLGLIATSSALTLSAQTSVDPEQSVGSSLLTMKNIQFGPRQLEIEDTQARSVLVENHDLTVHTFTIPGTNVDVHVTPGSESLVQLDGLAPGSYRFVCTIPGHEGMGGVLVIDP